MRKRNRPPRQRPSSQDLQGLSAHVAYECDMLIGTAAKLLESPPGDVIEQNALIESFLLHVRQLHQFFYRDQRRWDTDILAIDYGPAWPSARPADSAVLKELSTVVGSKVAHLTVPRLQKESYRIREGGRALLTVIRKFLDLAQPDFVARPNLPLTPSWANTGFVFSAGPGVSTTSSPPSVKDILLRADGPLPKSPVKR